MNISVIFLGGHWKWEGQEGGCLEVGELAEAQKPNSTEPNGNKSTIDQVKVLLPRLLQLPVNFFFQTFADLSWCQ